LKLWLDLVLTAPWMFPFFATLMLVKMLGAGTVSVFPVTAPVSCVALLSRYRRSEAVAEK